MFVVDLNYHQWVKDLQMNWWQSQVILNQIDGIKIQTICPGYEHVGKLAKWSQEQHNRELVSKDMKQFHIDFDVNNSFDDIYIYIYSIGANLIAKSSYWYFGIRDADHNRIQDNHKRLKTVPSSCIKYMTNHENTAQF